jgi:hypothetical protein
MSETRVSEWAGPTIYPAKFDAYEKDCFGRFINLTDNEVTTLILTLKQTIHSQGEYDQDDMVALEFDQVADLLSVAEELWRFRLNQGWNDPYDHDEVSENCRRTEAGHGMVPATGSVGPVAVALTGGEI